MIKTEDLIKVYNGVKAVESINVRVEKGQVCGFVGPNGAGKTTTIGMMTGLIEPTGGRCFVKDIEVSRHPIEVKKIIGYLPDGYGFYAHMTGVQNLRYFSKFYGVPDADARIKELLEYVGLGNVEKKAVGAYSRGMKQRLGLARALLNDPEVIFLDEPTNGLDPEGVIQFRKVIKSEAAKGKTVFFSCLVLDEVQHVCNTICIISKGKIMAQGTLEDVKKHMRKGPRFSIVVKVDKTMPKLAHPDIIDASYNDGSVTIKASSDIRDFIFYEVVRGGLRMRELRLEEESLEDVFLETVYGGAS